MNIEIIEFYPSSGDKEQLTGTLRVKLPDIGIHILGVSVLKNKNFWRFSLPGRNGVDRQSGEAIWYPFVVFECKEKQKNLVDAIREKGRAFIEKRLEDTEIPLVFPERKPQSQSIPSIDKSKDKQSDLKASSLPPQATPITVTRPMSAKPSDFVDPPARKATMRQFSTKKIGET